MNAQIESAGRLIQAAADQLNGAYALLLEEATEVADGGEQPHEELSAAYRQAGSAWTSAMDALSTIRLMTEG